MNPPTGNAAIGPTPSDIEALAALGRAIGRRVPWWTQGPGSNISRKSNGSLVIKATGIRLRDMGPPPSMATLSLPALQHSIQLLLQRDEGRGASGGHRAESDDEQADADYRAALAAHRQHGDAALLASGKPSMETGMHALLPGRDVLHLHALCAIVLAQPVPAQAAMLQRLSRNHGLRCAVVGAVVPGWPLCRAISRVAECEALLLQNHGLILQGDGPTVLSRWGQLEEEWLHTQPPGVAELAADDAMQRTWWRSPQPLRPMLPDTAVFWPQLQAASRPIRRMTRTVPSGAAAAPQADDADAMRAWNDSSSGASDAAELWAAGAALASMAPDLAPLSPEYVRRVQQLPQEKERLRVRATT